MSELVINNIQLGVNDLNSDQFTLKLNSNGTDTSVLELHKGKSNEISIGTILMGIYKDKIKLLKPESIHNNALPYNKGDKVKVDNVWYIAIEEVPIGASITNALYWKIDNRKVFDDDIVINNSLVLDSTYLNKFLVLNNNIPITVQLPLADTVKAGDGFILQGSNYNAVVNCSGTNLIREGDYTGQTSKNIIGAQTLIFISNNVGSWRVIDIHRLRGYSPIDTTSIYQKGFTYSNTSYRTFLFCVTYSLPTSNASYGTLNGNIVHGINNFSSNTDFAFNFPVPPYSTFGFFSPNATNYTSSIIYLEA